MNRLVALTDTLILKASGQDNVENITVLNLHGNGLAKLKPLNSLKCLRRLTVSYNELTRLDDLSYMVSDSCDCQLGKKLPSEKN